MSSLSLPIQGRDDCVHDGQPSSCSGRASGRGSRVCLTERDLEVVMARTNFASREGGIRAASFGRGLRSKSACRASTASAASRSPRGWWPGRRGRSAPRRSTLAVQIHRDSGTGRARGRIRRIVGRVSSGTATAGSRALPGTWTGRSISSPARQSGLDMWGVVPGRAMQLPRSGGIAATRRFRLYIQGRIECDQGLRESRRDRWRCRLSLAPEHRMLPRFSPVDARHSRTRAFAPVAGDRRLVSRQ